jgi:hypothetical protein
MPMAAAFFLGLPLPDSRDLAVDALEPHRVPHPHSVEAALSSVLGNARDDAL